MKRFILFFTAFALLTLLFSACGAPKASPDESPAPQCEPGEIADNVYRNDSIGVQFVIPSSWIVANEEEKRAILNAAEDDASTTYDILVGRQDMTSMVYLFYMDMSYQLGGTSMTPEELLESTAEELSASGFESGSLSSAQLNGVDFFCIDLNYAQNGICQRMFAQRFGKYIACIGISGTSPEEIDALMLRFTDDADSVSEDFSFERASDSAEAFNYCHGSVEDGAYASNYLNLTFSPPDGWSFFSDGELLELMGLDSASGSFEQAVSSQLVVQEMTAVAPDGDWNVNIALEDTSYYLGYSDISPADYIEIAKEQLSSQSDIVYVLGSSYGSELFGKDCCVLEASSPEYEMYQNLYVFRTEQYVVLVAITSAYSNDMSQVEAYFSAAQ